MQQLSRNTPAFKADVVKSESSEQLVKFRNQKFTRKWQYSLFPHSSYMPSWLKVSGVGAWLDALVNGLNSSFSYFSW